MHICLQGLHRRKWKVEACTHVGMYAYISLHVRVHLRKNVHVHISACLHTYMRKYTYKCEYTDTVVNHVLDLHPTHGCNSFTCVFPLCLVFQPLFCTFTRQLCVHTVLATRESRGRLLSLWVINGAHLASTRTLTNDLLHQKHCGEKRATKHIWNAGRGKL